MAVRTGSAQVTRAEVPVEETWRLEDIFPSVQEWEAELAALTADRESLNRFAGRLGEGAGVLLECLMAAHALSDRVSRVYNWAQLQLYADGTSPQLQAQMGRVMPLLTMVRTDATRIRSELLQLPEGTLEAYLGAEPGLEPFRLYLEQLAAERPHALTPEAEQAVASLGEILGLPYQLFNRATTSDMRFDPAADGQGNQVPVTIGNFLMDIEVSPDTALRRSAWRSLVGGLRPYENTMAATMAANIRRNVLMARMRGYKSAAQMMLESSYATGAPQGVSVDFYENWMETLQSELAPHMRRYARLRKRVLGLDSLLLCDVSASVESAEYRLSYEQGARWIQESVAMLGEEYGQIFRQAFAERWIDRADNAGRAGMAFCQPVPGVHCYVFSTWTDKLRGLFILAHEMGHAGHLELSMRYQPYTSYSPLFVEAPSTLNELLLARHIRQTTSDPALHRQVIISLLNTYHHNCVTHLLEAELLRRLYTIAERDMPLTAQIIGNETAAMLRKFWGEEVEIDGDARLNWMRQPHYYMGLYPYTYSVGLAGATRVAQLIEEQGAPVAGRWVETLKLGGSVRPEELFRRAGVDVADPGTLRSAAAYVGQLVDDLEQASPAVKA